MDVQGYKFASAEIDLSGDSKSNDNSTVSLPGLNCSLNTMPVEIYERNKQDRTIRRMRFPTAVIDGDRSEENLAAFTYREIVMLRIMNELTDKPDWNRKIFDTNLTRKWRAEAMAAHSADVTDKCIDYVS